MKKIPVVIVGAGPYGLSLAAHLGACGIEHRIFGKPMRFWAQVAEAANERYLKTFCFASSLSAPKPGFTFADYNIPRGLETFEPCSMGNFAEYGQWFQQQNVGWSEPTDVTQVEPADSGFRVTLGTGERLLADRVVVATGLANFAYTPSVFAALPPQVAMHTSRVTSFKSFKGRSVAIVGAGQSALEAAALLVEAGAYPQLLVRENQILWHSRTHQQRSLWQRMRWPISGLGVGPKAWALYRFPGALQQLPDEVRDRLTKNYLGPEGAWWLRDRVENRLPIHLGATVIESNETNGQASLKVQMAADGSQRELKVDHVIAGSGYDINVDRIHFLDPALKTAIQRINRSPRLDSRFETSVGGLHFIGPTSAMSFGPLFRFVVGADYTARYLSAHIRATVPTTIPAPISKAA